MSIQQEITKAIGMHAMWKNHLKSAIASGKSQYNPTTVCQDNQCEFGKWLHGLDAGAKSNGNWQNVRQVHADFHKEAGNVLQLATSGRKAEADASLSAQGKFTVVSMKLTSEMMAWAKVAP